VKSAAKKKAARMGFNPMAPSIDDLVSSPPAKKARSASTQATVDRKRSTASDKPEETTKVGKVWEAENQRVTFYCPKDLLSRLQDAVSEDRSKSAIIVEALTKEFEYRTR